MGCTIYIHIYMKVDVLQWRHNARDGVQNHQPHDCLLNRLFRHRWKKKSKLRVTGLCDRCHWLRWPVNSPHKVPVTRKKFPFEDVIMVLCHRIMSFLQLYIIIRKLRGTEAQRYHCKYDCTTASFILLPRVLSYCREFYFTAASFILAPRVLFYCREFYFSTASFILLPRDLFYCREFCFHHREFYFTTARFVWLPRVLFSPPRVLFYCK